MIGRCLSAREGGIKMAWYHTPGYEQDVVVMTAMTLARNLADQPFSARLDAARARKLPSLVAPVLEGNGFSRIDFSDISRTAAYALAEQMYVTPAFVRESRPRTLFLNEPCGIAVMVGGEDHFLIRGVRAGLATEDVLAGILEVERRLDEVLPFAYDDTLGYLTASPTDLGTGLRASILLSLPLLCTEETFSSPVRHPTATGQRLTRLDGTPLCRLTAHGVPGLTESETVDLLDRTTRRFLHAERARRTALTSDQTEDIKDRVLRAEGLLKSACLLGADEIPALLSSLRLGAALGLLSDSDGRPRVRVEDLTALLVEAMPAGVSPAATDAPVTTRERNRLRAVLVRGRLSITA